MLTSQVLLSGRYELDERIGAGGHSEVWRAADLTLARLVAVKLLYGGFPQHADALARFRAEARHAGCLSQENIARVYDYVEPTDGGPPFLVMELIDGPSLASVLLDGPLDPAPAARVIAQAAAGLQAAHQAGLIHRDIKPGNLLVSPEGTVKVADFGISHAVGAEPMTGTGLLLGTPGYLAPERVAGGPATPASDLYALGIVAWECLAGRPPFTGTALEVALAHRDQELPPLPVGAPPALADLIARLTARDPRDRPESAAAVAAQASELAGGAPAAVRAGHPRGRPALATSAGAGPTRAAPAGRGPARVAPVGQSGRRALPMTDQLAWRPAEAGTPAARRGGRWRRPRRMLLGVAAVVAMLAGLVAASQLGPLALSRVAAQPSGRPLPRATGTQLITVSADFLAGQSVAAVARRLRREGLKVRVRWHVSSARPPGTVLSVSPSGYRPAGSLVTVVGARAPAAAGQVAGAGAGPGHGHGRGNGDDGRGRGGGGD
ncbi:MAG TPA: serine/threonine-protein kinase [Streptosporangiaceae bacterium]|nr:serine/threonine-protein kinase [Streptosporangiaceae bacterium]